VDFLAHFSSLYQTIRSGSDFSHFFLDPFPDLGPDFTGLEADNSQTGLMSIDNSFGINYT